MINKLQFNSFSFNQRKQVLIGIDEDEKYLIKIQVFKNANKTNDIKKEYEILKHLNEKNSASCPKVFDYGEIPKQEITEKVSEDDLKVLSTSRDNSFEYILQEYVADDLPYSLADILFTLIEQKKLGVYQGDVKPANIRFSKEKGICTFIDYDQSILLTEEQIEMSNPDYLQFCSHYDKEKYGFGDWLRHFPNYSQEDLSPLLVNGALNLKETRVFNIQNTTNTPNGIYHTIDEKDIFIQGSRTIDERKKLLDQVSFSKNEKVLDVGCNAGLLSMYLHDRGCNVFGIDNDKYIPVAAKMVCNIIGKNIDFKSRDLDYIREIGTYDTVMLFSVLHHTINPIANAKKISESCNRVIIEARLFENGKQPINGIWTNVNRWVFNTLDELVLFLETIFEGFKLKTNLGQASKSRYILEFVKK